MPAGQAIEPLDRRMQQLGVGRIVPSDAATESLFVPEGNPKNEIARFRTLRSQILGERRILLID
jgi:hypothetical protein